MNSTNTRNPISRFLSNSPNATVAALTPEEVDYLLDHNPNNRHVIASAVSQWAEDMSNGYWEVTSEGIGIDRDGNLVDGQHRLEALKRNGYPPLLTTVAYGLKPEVRKVTNIGRKRSFAAAFSVSGYSQTSVIVSGARYLHCLLHGDYFGRMSSPYALVKHYAELTSALSDKIHFGGHASRCVSSAAYVGTMFYAILCGHDLDLIIRFHEDMKTGENLSRDTPTLRLRNKLMGRGKYTAYQIAGMTARCLVEHFRNGNVGMLKENEVNAENWFGLLVKNGDIQKGKSEFHEFLSAIQDDSLLPIWRI